MASTVPSNRIAVKAYEQNGQAYRKLVKRAWGKYYRSCDEGENWFRTSSEAFWAAFHANKLQPMAAEDVAFLQSGGIILA